jgi:hypothetical protein
LLEFLDALFCTAGKGREGVGHECTQWVLVASKDPGDRHLGTWGRATPAAAQSSKPARAREKRQPSVEDPAKRRTTAALGERRVGGAGLDAPPPPARTKTMSTGTGRGGQVGNPRASGEPVLERPPDLRRCCTTWWRGGELGRVMTKIPLRKLNQ